MFRKPANAPIYDLSRSHRVDWERLIMNLRRMGWSIEAIAKYLGVSKSTISNYCAPMRCEPPYWTGSRLIVLWCAETRCTPSDVPTRQAEPSVADFKD